MDNDRQQQLQIASQALLQDPEGAFDPFYQLTKDKAFYLIYSYVREEAAAEDILQEAYIALLENTGKLACRHNPEAFLMSVAKHKAIDELRRRKPEVRLDEEGTEEVIGNADPPSDETGVLLHEIQGLLNPFEFRVYTLHVLSGLSFREIVPLVHRPLGTLTYTYRAAIEKLQKGLNPLWMRNSNPN
jgi:RNA polymerase sigma-70 factor (ECF subfamily)